MIVARGSLEWHGSDNLLLVGAGVVVEHVEERLDVELREDARRVQQVMGHLRVVRWRLDRVPRHIILGPMYDQ